jgi:Flp pilus assembly pilin Flp
MHSPGFARPAGPSVAGQTMTEYALILAAVVSVVFLGMKTLGKMQTSLSATAGSVSIDLGSANTVDNMIDK